MTYLRLCCAKRVKPGLPLTPDALTRFVWLRQFEVGQNSADMNRLLNRLEFLRGIALDESILSHVPPHRIAILAACTLNGVTPLPMRWARPMTLLSERHGARRSAHAMPGWGDKSTCKDRWRQILAEAEKISCKHLLTLDPGISEPQTNQMEVSSLQLVVPAPVHGSYTDAQRGWLWSVGDFIGEVRARQTSRTRLETTINVVCWVRTPYL